MQYQDVQDREGLLALVDRAGQKVELKPSQKPLRLLIKSKPTVVPGFPRLLSSIEGLGDGQAPRG